MKNASMRCRTPHYMLFRVKLGVLCSKNLAYVIMGMQPYAWPVLLT